jgi:hypothetical protein
MVVTKEMKNSERRLTKLNISHCPIDVLPPYSAVMNGELQWTGSQ